QADDHLRRGDDDHHEGEDLPVLAVEEAPEGDEGEVDGVEHQLDRHEDDQRVAPDQHAQRADHEQRGAQPDQPGEDVEAHVRRLPLTWWRVRYTAPMAATMSSSEVISKGIRKVVKSWPPTTCTLPALLTSSGKNAFCSGWLTWPTLAPRSGVLSHCCWVEL